MIVSAFESVTVAVYVPSPLSVTALTIAVEDEADNVTVSPDTGAFPVSFSLTVTVLLVLLSAIAPVVTLTELYVEISTTPQDLGCPIVSLIGGADTSSPVFKCAVILMICS